MLLVVSFAIADKPIQVNTEAGLEIKYPPFEWVEPNQNIEFPFHVYNKESGLALNSSVTCDFHLYNNIGEHIFIDSSNTAVHGYDYEFAVGKNNFSNGEYYAFNVYCECDGCGVDDKDLGGFVSTAFLVSSKNPVLQTTELLSLIVGIGIIIFLLFYFGNNLDSEHLLLKLLTIFFGLFGLLLIPNALINGVSAVYDNILNLVVNFIIIFSVYLFVYLNYTIWLKNKLIDWKFIKSPKQNTLPKGK